MMISLPVSDPSQVAEARRALVAVARACGFGEEAAGRAAIVATELATNLVKHGHGGQLLSAPFDDHDGISGIEIIAIDKGPGISDIGSALRDGMSTSGTAGNGLGAVMRQSHAFDVFSRPGIGTAIVARLEPGRLPRPGAPRAASFPAWGAISVPCPGEDVNGDDWCARADDHGLTLMVADGLGHGPHAADAATHAVRLFDKHWQGPPVEALQSMHAGLRATRGAAVAIARIDLRAAKVVFAGVGNVAGTILAADGQSRRMLSHNGTLGHAARRIQAIEYPVTDVARATVVMHSDGIATGWSTEAYPGLLAAHPALIAAVLFRDFVRGPDDATVLVARGTAAAGNPG